MKITEFLLDLLYPPKCPFCGHLLDIGEKGICLECEKKLPYVTTEPQKGDFFESCVSPLYYENDVRRAMLKYKFHGCTGYAGLFGKMMAECVQREYKGEYDLISWVPLSRARKFRRGYDQALLLAEEMAACLGDKTVKTLRKRKNIKAQSSTGSEEKRRANVAGVYETCSERSVIGMRVLLVDDIITTGATLSECARTLRMAGALKVLCVTVARARE